jgi:hypothetical protein
VEWDDTENSYRIHSPFYTLGVAAQRGVRVNMTTTTPKRSKAVEYVSIEPHKLRHKREKDRLGEGWSDTEKSVCILYIWGFLWSRRMTLV